VRRSPIVVICRHPASHQWSVVALSSFAWSICYDGIMTRAVTRESAREDYGVEVRR